MLKAIGALQLALAPMFVIPQVTAQDDVEGAAIGQSLEQQLQSTVDSIEYLVGLRSAARAGDSSAVRAIADATEGSRGASPQRNSKLAELQDGLARLRFQLDKLLSDPAEVAALAQMPPSVLRTLGLGGQASAATEPAALEGRSGTDAPSGASPVTANSPSTAPTHPKAPFNPMAARPDDVRGTEPTTGLASSMRAAIQGEVPPLHSVSDSSRRRGDEAVALEGDSYVADPVHLGKLLVRASRPSEALEVLKLHQTTPGARYWLARALQDLDRDSEAVTLFRQISEDKDAGLYARHAAQDLDFLEFKAALKRR